MSHGRELRNQRAQARLLRALPAIFPRAVVVHALSQPWTPPLPRLAIESYWRMHPVRADRLARRLAARSGSPEGWCWRPEPGSTDKRPGTFREPPAPFRDAGFARGPGYCCVCGQPVFRFGWHRDLWQEDKPNGRARWHAACVAAWKLWNAPGDQLRVFSRLQGRRCAVTGTRLLKTAEVDHRVPLFRVWREHADLGWPQVLAFWGVPNLQAVNRTAHRAKSAQEASHRASRRTDPSHQPPGSQGSGPVP